MLTLQFFIVVLVKVILVDSAKILCVYAFPSYSHHLVFRELTNALADKGHELTVITPIPDKVKHVNVTEIDTSEIIPILKNVIAEYDLKRGIKITSDMITVDRQMSLYKMIKATFENENVKDLLSKELKFDLVITQPIFQFPMALAEIYNAPLILFSSAYGFPHNYAQFGAPYMHPFVYGHCYRDRKYNLSLWEKIYELYIEMKLWYVFNEEVKMEHKLMIEYFGDKAPTVEKLYESPDLMFLNINPIFEGNRPVPPNVIFLGGLHLKPAKQLSSDWQTYLDESKNGIIYVSLGTNVQVSTMNRDLLEVFLKAFESLPYDILWKFDGNTLPRNISNVKTSNWFPQRDLLLHPKIKAFVTQGGLQSTDEAIDARVPLVGLPMLADQSNNCERYVHLGIGLKLDVLTLTAEDLVNGINTVVNERRYKENIESLSMKMRDQPEPALTRAVWWTEYVIRHKGAKHLKTPMASVTWFEYLMIDVAMVTMFVVMKVAFVFYLVVRGVCGFGFKGKVKMQ